METTGKISTDSVSKFIRFQPEDQKKAIWNRRHLVVSGDKLVCRKLNVLEKIQAFFGYGIGGKKGIIEVFAKMKELGINESKLPSQFIARYLWKSGHSDVVKSILMKQGRQKLGEKNAINIINSIITSNISDELKSKYISTAFMSVCGNKFDSASTEKT